MALMGATFGGSGEAQVPIPFEPSVIESGAEAMCARRQTTFDGFPIQLRCPSNPCSRSFRFNFDNVPIELQNNTTSTSRQFRWLSTTLDNFDNWATTIPWWLVIRTMVCFWFNWGLFGIHDLPRTSPDTHVELSSVCVHTFNMPWIAVNFGWMFLCYLRYLY